MRLQSSAGPFVAALVAVVALAVNGELLAAGAADASPAPGSIVWNGESKTLTAFLRSVPRATKIVIRAPEAAPDGGTGGDGGPSVPGNGTGDGGCGCHASPATGTGAALLATMTALPVVHVRRRRRRSHAHALTRAESRSPGRRP